MTSRSTAREYERRARIQLADSLSGKTTCRFCGKPIEYTDVAVCGFPAGYPLECDCLHRMYLESRAEGCRDAEGSTFLAKLAAAGVPARYRTAATGLPIASAYIHGAVGTGKTYAACAVLIKAVKAGLSAMFVSTSDIQDASFERRSDLYAQMRRADVLCIDDLGKAETGDWADSLAFRAVDVRYGTGKTTLVTSNYSKPELARLIERTSSTQNAAAVVSRLAQMCGNDIEMTGRDRRVAANDQEEGDTLWHTRKAL